jgi:hypothetical protein
MRDAAMMLLPLRGPLRDTVTFCAFEKIREPTTAHKWCWEQRSDCLPKELLHAKRDLKIENQVLICVSNISQCWSQWPRGLRRRSAAPRLMELWVRIPPEAWMSVCCKCLSGKGLCVRLSNRPEESYRVWWVCSWSLNNQEVYLSGSRNPWLLKMGQIDCPETSLRNYHYTPWVWSSSLNNQEVYLRGSRKPWLLKMRQIDCPETPLRNYHYTPCNNLEERKSLVNLRHFLRLGLS